MHAPFTVRPSSAQVMWSLHRGRLRKPLVCVVPEHDSPLYRILWPDLGPSAPANLSRCIDAAQQWAEQSALTEDRKSNAARRLRSLNNLLWSRSWVRQNGREAM